MSTRRTRRPSRLYHVDTYPGGYLMKASSISAARRAVTRTSVSHMGHTVKRATRADRAYWYPVLS